MFRLGTAYGQACAAAEAHAAVCCGASAPLHGSPSPACCWVTVYCWAARWLGAQDGQMAYKQAMAFAATGDAAHAEIAQRIMEGWATVNKVWGLQYENGPLGECPLSSD